MLIDSLRSSSCCQPRIFQRGDWRLKCHRRLLFVRAMLPLSSVQLEHARSISNKLSHSRSRFRWEPDGNQECLYHPNSFSA